MSLAVYRWQSIFSPVPQLITISCRAASSPFARMKPTHFSTMIGTHPPPIRLSNLTVSARARPNIPPPTGCSERVSEEDNIWVHCMEGDGFAPGFLWPKIIATWLKFITSLWVPGIWNDDWLDNPIKCSKFLKGHTFLSWNLLHANLPSKLRSTAIILVLYQWCITLGMQDFLPSYLWYLERHWWQPHWPGILVRCPGMPTLGSRGFSLSESWGRNHGRRGTGSASPPWFRPQALRERETSGTQGKVCHSKWSTEIWH